MYNDFCDLILEKNKFFKNDMNEKAKVNVYQNVALKFFKANNVFFLNDHSCHLYIFIEVNLFE